ncbi:MAG: sigma-70 family RNA polymerase sigma factor [Piscinibacter sp.]
MTTHHLPSIPALDDTSAAGFADTVSSHRSYLIRFASRRLRDAALVEDVVQETLLAALQAQASFDGRASLRTWMTGILLRRIADSVRGQRRRPIVQALGDEGGDDPTHADLDETADAEAIDWVDPQRHLAGRQFLAALAGCLDELPPLSARLFALREIDGLSNEEAASALGLSARGSSVLLHRARASLRVRLAPHAELAA